MTKQEAYIELLHSKIRIADKVGITVDRSRFHPSTKPHQADIIFWSLQLGRALVAPDCGLGKTHISIEVLRLLQEEFGGKCLVVTELGASDTYCSKDPEVGEGARLGIDIDFIRTTEDALNSHCSIVVTNYESVRIGKIDFSQFTAVWLDEGNYIKNMASETTESLKQQLKKVKYKFIATATPSPNETVELINYAHVLEIADRGQILTQYYDRNSVVAGDFTLTPQHEADFWLFVHSWMVAIERPSDLGYSDEGYDLSELEIIWHEVRIGKALEAGNEKNGQGVMFINTGNSLPDNAKIKRESIDVRVTAAIDIINQKPDEHWIIWHHLESERKILNKAFKSHASYADIFGAMPMESREKRVVDFTKGDLQILATKPELNGVGCNFQKHSCHSVLIGINNDWDELYQLMKRQHRFGQKNKCYLHIFYTPEEYSIKQNIERKMRLHKDQRAWLTGLVRKHGLDHSAMVEERKRTFKTERKEFNGKRYKLIETDAIMEWFNLEDNRFGMMNSSFPFGNHYEYTNFLNDLGHNLTNNEFIKQMDFLVPELLRTLQPGRIITVHLKNRIHYGSVTGKGFSVFHRFTHLVCEMMEKHGFETMGFHYIPTCVVGENNQTYRLGYSEMQKDSTKMGSGIPEEIWVFRKPPTSTANSYADVPVTHNCECPLCHHRNQHEYFKREGAITFYCNDCKQFFAKDDLIVNSEHELSLAHWQIDADSFWSSSGNRYISPHELKAWDLKKIRAWWNRFNKEVIYDYDMHVQLLQDLENAGKLSREWTTLPLVSNTEYIWHNVNRMRGLNMEQQRRNERNHICPQPFDEADRCIELYSNEDDEIADPFGGLCTTGVRGVKKGRRAFITELNSTYAKCGSIYLREAEQKKEVPTLFDLLQEVA